MLVSSSLQGNNFSCVYCGYYIAAHIYMQAIIYFLKKCRQILLENKNFTCNEKSGDKYDSKKHLPNSFVRL